MECNIAIEEMKKVRESWLIREMKKARERWLIKGRRENEVQEYHFKKREAHKIFGNKKILYINNIIYSK